MACSSLVSALIVAGGKGERLGGAVRKQYLTLCGRSILSHTVGIFARLDEVGEIVIAAPADDVAYIRDDLLVREFGAGVGKPLCVTPGGATRQESVRAGLAAADPRSEMVLVHDAVRPFVQPAHIQHVLERARQHGAAILATPVKDTLKRCEARSITDTVPREGLYAAQTPQAFNTAKLREAHDTAARRGLTATDDAALFEALGCAVEIVDGSGLNIKITTAEDLRLADAIAQSFFGATT